MYQNQRSCRPYNNYQKREHAQRRNKEHKYEFRASQKYHGNNHNYEYHQYFKSYCNDEKTSVDSLHKRKQSKLEISSIYIPSHNKSETYDENGHIMYLSYDATNHYLNIAQFIRTITNREGTHYIQRAKLLKVDTIQTQLFQLKITVSSPLIFQKLFNIHNENQPIIRVNNMNFKYKIPLLYHVKSYCKFLKLCIKEFSANQDVAVWSSSNEEWAHPISYYIHNELFIYLGDCDGTEYKITINPKDIYYIQYRKDGYNEYKLNKEYHLKLRLYRPCSISKLPITRDDERHGLIFPPIIRNSWINSNGKIFRQCGNQHIYDDGTIYRRNPNDFDYETSLEMLPKMIGKALILFFAFDSEPTALLQWIEANKPRDYDYFNESQSLVSPPNITTKNEYRDNLLQLRGGRIIDESVIDQVDCLINGARIADEYVMHEQELTATFLEILGNNKYMTRFVNRSKENKDQALIRYALQYYGCYTVKYLKQKILNTSNIGIFKSDSILKLLISDTSNRIFNNKFDLLITAPFSNHNTMEIKRVLVTPTRCIMCPVEHWPLSNIFKWILDKKYMDHLLFISFVTEDLEAMPCSMLNASNGSHFGAILKKYILNGMNDGRIIICNRTYQYLMSTPQLFRHRTLCFFQSAMIDGKHLRCMQLMNRVCRAALTTNGIITHWATQRFLPSITIIKHIKCKEKDGDGQGIMPWSFMYNLYHKLLQENNKKLSLYRLNIDEYKDGVYPSLIRFAYKGYFGVLTLHPFDTNDKEFVFSKSQKKYRFPQSDVMEIYEFSCWKPAYLKPNAIFVLQSLGINVQIIYDFVRDRLKLLNHARRNDKCAQHLLCNLDYLDIPAIINDIDGNGYSFKDSVWIKALRCNLLSESEVFFTKFIQIIIENELRILRSQYKVMMDYKDGALLFGCIDELQILNKNQVFIQTFDKELERWDIWKKGDKVLIYNENHIYYPSDVIVMECAYYKELQRIYRNVIVFPHPSKGESYIECGGATLNGETQFICIRNQNMIPNKKYNVNAEYVTYPHNTHNDKPASAQNIMEYAYNTIANHNIDVDVWNLLWLCYADTKGAKCKECKDISIEIYKAKNYHLLHMKLADIDKYKCDLFPSWIKEKHNLFKNMKMNHKTKSVMKYIADIIDRKYRKYKLSSRTLGYDVILKKEENDIIRRYRRNGSSICDIDLMNELNDAANDWKHTFTAPHFISQILDLKNAFDFDLFLRCKQYGVINEIELLTAKLVDLSTKQMSSMDWNEYQLLLLRRKQFLCGRDESYSTKTVLSKMMHDVLYHYRNKLINCVDLQSDSLYAKSMYIYHLIYKENFEIVNSKQNYPFPSLLFAWILADYWLQIKIYVKQNKRSNPNIDRVYINHTFNLNTKYKEELCQTPGFIGNTAKDKEEILIEHEKQITRNDEESDHKHCPIPHFIVDDNINYDNDNDNNNDTYYNEYNVSINNYDDVEKYYKQSIINHPKNEHKKDLSSLLYKTNEYYQNDNYLNTAMHHHRNRNNNNHQSELHYVPPK